jgi:broad specificity phosphatase PhoE
LCSTAKRAIETQELSTGWVTQCYGIQPVFSKELEEMDQGDWEGRRRDEVYTPEVYDKIEAYPLHFKAPNGESKYDVGIRMGCFIHNNIILNATREKETKVAIFTHGFAIKCWLYTVLQFLPSLIYNIRIDNASITNLCYCQSSHSHWNIKYINRTFYSDWRE